MSVLSCGLPTVIRFTAACQRFAQEQSAALTPLTAAPHAFKEGGPKHLAARKACIEVLEGIKKARAARLAFEEAAKEADIFDDSGTRPIPKPVDIASHGPPWRGRKRKLKRDM